MVGLAKTLGALAQAIEAEHAVQLFGKAETLVSDLSSDSRRIPPGAMFVAFRGQQADGISFVDQAIGNGAVAVMCSSSAGNGTTSAPLTLSVPTLAVSDTRRAVGPLAATLFDYPARHLHTIGVTGTTGKTTVAHLTYEILTGIGVKVGMVGTICNRIGENTFPTGFTTPEAPDLQRFLAQTVAAKAKFGVMEVSSHGLAQHRVDGIEFDVSVFTNLGWDHLDFHPDRHHYQATKFSLFTPERSRRAVIWVDDPDGVELAQQAQIDVVGVSATDPQADLYVETLELNPQSSHAQLTSSTYGTFLIKVPLPGRFNLTNAALATAAVLEFGIEPDDISESLSTANPPPGRFETLTAMGMPRVIIDYAHTPEAIEQVCREVIDLYPESRVVVVFGAGGDRDHSKREQMGAAASQAAVVVVTSDNPRSEDPVQIIEQVAMGVKASTELIKEVDRELAIRLGLAKACPEDVVLVLGKGHEQRQLGPGGARQFSDREMVSELLTDFSETGSWS